MSDNKERKAAPTLPPGTMRAIGRALRRMYAHIIAATLQKLDEASNGGTR